MPTYGKKFKVRTGCITCKIRKVKCDENKPACIRCTSTGRKCDGYTLPSSTDADDSKKRQGLIVRQHDRAVTAIVNNTLQANIAVLPFVESDHDHRWLQYFTQHAGPTMADIADTDFWTHVLPQLSVSEPAIRHALLAVGSSYARFNSYYSMTDGQGQLAGITERNYSIKHYSLAVTKLRQSLVEAPEKTTVPLVCCLLFICFECLIGNRLLMLDHLNNGLNILSSIMKRSSNSSIHNDDKSLVTGKLKQIFHRLDAQATLYGKQMSSMLGNPNLSHEIDIPYTFTSVLEAKKCLDMITSASLAFNRIFSAFIRGPRDPTVSVRQRRLQEQFMSWRNAIDNFDVLTPTQNSYHRDITTRLRTQCYAGFIYLSNCLELDETCYDAYMAQFATLISLARKLLPSTQDLAMPELSSLSINSSTKTKSEGARAGFSLEASLIPSLYLTALKCRDPNIRREAISLLGLNCGREGLWDARMHWKVARRALEIEERSALIDQGSTDAFMEDVPSLKMRTPNGVIMKGLPHERFRLQNTDIFRGFEEESRTAQVVFCTRPDGPDGLENHWVEEIFF